MQTGPVGPLELFHQLPCLSLVTDMTGQILICNGALLEALGKTEIASLFGPVDRQLLQTSIWPSLMRRESVCEQAMQIEVARQGPVPVLVNVSKDTASDHFLLVLMAAATGKQADT